MLLLCTGMAFAGSLEPGLGWAHAQLNDRHQTPLPYGASGPQVRLGVAATPARARLFGRFEAQVGGASAPVERALSEASWIDAALEIGGDAQISSGRTRVYVGASVGKRLELIDGMALHVWGLGTGALGARLRVEREVGRVGLAGEVTVPVVVAISRHNWSLDPVVPGRGDVAAFYTVGTRLVAVGQLLDMRARVEVTLPVTERVQWGLTASARYLTYPEPAPVRRLALDLSTGPRVALGGRS